MCECYFNLNKCVSCNENCMCACTCLHDDFTAVSMSEIENLIILALLLSAPGKD